jgi:hypothetical protein
MSPCDGQSRNDQRADKPPLSIIEHSCSLCALHSNSGNRGMQKDMPKDDIFVPTTARKD